MPVTNAELRRALRNGRFKPETIDFPSDGTAGQFGDGSTALGADEDGVLCTIEVGEDAPLADAVAVYLGQFAGPMRNMPPQLSRKSAGRDFLEGQTRINRLTARIRTATPGDAQSSARFGYAAAKSAQATSPKALSLQKYEDYDPNHVSNVTEIPVLRVPDFGWTAAVEGEFINVVVNPGATGAETYDFDETDSDIQLPVLKWDGS